jgi:hypothetical protein
VLAAAIEMKGRLTDHIWPTIIHCVPATEIYDNTITRSVTFQSLKLYVADTEIKDFDRNKSWLSLAQKVVSAYDGVL